jgi:hypothetical protein
MDLVTSQGATTPACSKTEPKRQRLGMESKAGLISRGLLAPRWRKSKKNETDAEDTGTGDGVSLAKEI